MANPAKGQGGGVQDHGCGGSSTASGSSSRSISAAARAAAAAASRLRKANNTAAGFGIGMEAGAAEGASIAGSASGMSGCLDVSTPKSYVVAGDASTSPVNSSAGEDDTEYNEAQLVFGLPGAAASIPVGATAAADSGAAPAAQVNGSLNTVRVIAAAPAGESDNMPLQFGVDWTRIAALQEAQPQQMASGYHSHLHSHSMPGGQQLLLFGVDDILDDVPPVHLGHGPTAALTVAQAMQQQLAAFDAHMHTAGGLSACRGWPGDQAAGSLFAPQGGSAPAASAVHEMVLQPGTAALTADATCFGAAATAAELAESVLHDTDRRPGAKISHLGLQHLHQNGINLQSYSSVHSDRSSAGQWAASVQASQQQQQQQHSQEQRASDTTGDISSSSDQMKQGSTAGAGPVGTAAAGPGKQVGASAAVKEKAAAGTGVAAAPRLTGWASIAAKDPKVTAAPPAAPPNTSASANGTVGRDSGSTAGGAAALVTRQQQQQQGVGGGVGGGGGVKSPAGPLSRLPAAVRSEVQALLAQFPGVLKVRGQVWYRLVVEEA